MLHLPFRVGCSCGSVVVVVAAVVGAEVAPAAAAAVEELLGYPVGFVLEAVRLLPAGVRSQW